MDKSKFEKIFNSNMKHEVLYQNRPIWIQDYNQKRGVAKVENLDNGEINVVSINDLDSTGKISGEAHTKHNK